MTLVVLPCMIHVLRRNGCFWLVGQRIMTKVSRAAHVPTIRASGHMLKNERVHAGSKHAPNRPQYKLDRACRQHYHLPSPLLTTIR